MKKIMSVVTILLLFTMLCGCQRINDENSTSESNVNKITTFDIGYEKLINIIKNNGYSYEEVNEYNFENKEANSIGVIYINPNDNLDIVRTQIRHSYNKVFKITVSYTITEESPMDTSDKLTNLYGIILQSIKPDVPTDFIRNLDKYSDDYYSKDFNDLRVSISYKDTVIEVTFVCLDFIE